MRKSLVEKLIVLSLIFVLTFIFILPFSLVNIDTHHDGILLKPAIDVAQGKVLFRDTFVEYGALTTFVQAASIKLFGEYLLAMRLTTVFSYAVLAVLLWIIWSKFLPRNLTLISLILWLALAYFYDGPFHSWSSVYALVFQCVSFLAVLAFCKKQKYIYLIIAGAGASLAYWFRQPVGVFLYLAIGGFIMLLAFLKIISLKKMLSSLLSISAGFIIVSLPLLVYILKNGALHDWWIQSFVFPAVFTRFARGISLDQVLKSLSIAKFWKQIYAYFIWLALPLSIVYLTLKTLISLLKKKKSLRSTSVSILAAGFICLASWMQYYPVTEPSHFFWAATPMVGFLIYVLFNFFRQEVHLEEEKTVAISALIVSVFFVLRVIPGINRVQKAKVYSDSLLYLRYIRLTPNEKKTIDTFVTRLNKYLDKYNFYINTSPDAFISLYNQPRYQMIPPLTSYGKLMSDVLYPDYVSKVQKYVRAAHPVVVDRESIPLKDYCMVQNIYYFDPSIHIYIWVANSSKFGCRGLDTIRL